MPIIQIPQGSPSIHDTAFIAPDATVSGNVIIGEESSVWFGCVIRGDTNSIRIGKRSNIQDVSVLHTDYGPYDLKIEDDVTVGHRVMLHGCHIKSRSLIGIGAILLNGVVVESDSMIAAGALVTPGTQVPSGVLMMRSPAKVKRELTETERKMLLESAQHYVENRKNYMHPPA